MSSPFTSSDRPMKNQIETELAAFASVVIEVAYQKIILRITNTTATTPAQKRGFWYTGTFSIGGIVVCPYTKPANALSGMGFVARLTTTVTTTQTMNDHSA